VFNELKVKDIMLVHHVKVLLEGECPNSMMFVVLVS